MTQSEDSKDERINALIDSNLKRVYSDLAKEELPDRFKDLLAVLKAQDSEKSKIDGETDA